MTYEELFRFADQEGLTVSAGAYVWGMIDAAHGSPWNPPPGYLEDQYHRGWSYGLSLTDGHRSLVNQGH